MLDALADDSHGLAPTGLGGLLVYPCGGSSGPQNQVKTLLSCVSTVGLLSENTLPETVRKKLHDTTYARKRKCSGLIESQIKSSSRVESHSNSNTSSIEDINASDEERIPYNAYETIQRSKCISRAEVKTYPVPKSL